MDVSRVLIVGGGIAGLGCALRLLRAGHQVTLVEQQKGPIDKVCGEGILPFGLELLEEMGLKEALLKVGFPFCGISYCLGDTRVSAQFEQGKSGLGIDRQELDRLLKEACLAFKEFEIKIGRLLPGAGTPAGYDQILIADGINSRWASEAGLKKRASSRLGLRFRFRTRPPEKVQIHFFPSCEIYFTPTDTQTLSVAFLVDKNKIPVRGSELQSWCLDLLHHHFPTLANAPLINSGTRGPIASVNHSNIIPRVHLLGDAWRAFDPISGAGMSFALLCGKLAAENLHDPAAYYRALKPSIKAISEFTNVLLFFRGGGLRTRLMLRQLSKAPETFQRILNLHDGKHRFTDLDLQSVGTLLKI